MKSNEIRRASGLGRVRSLARTHYLLLFMTPLPPQWHSGPQMTHTDEGYGLRWATLQSTETITWLQPNRPDQIYTMHQVNAGISLKSQISLPGYSQMDFEIHRFSYLFKNLITSEQYRKPELFISHKDFYCFELLGPTKAHDFPSKS